MKKERKTLYLSREFVMVATLYGMKNGIKGGLSGLVEKKLTEVFEAEGFDISGITGDREEDGGVL